MLSASLSSWICTGGIVVTLFAAAAVVLGVPARFLVWSVVGHCGLILAGIGLASKAKAAAGVDAAVLYAVNIAFAQLLAWIAWRSMRGTAKSWDFSPARGMGKRTPVLAWAFTVGLFGLAGLPPSPGFFARIMLFGAGFQAAGPSGYAAVIACSLQSLAWLAVALYAAAALWLGPPPTRPVRPSPQSVVIALTALALVVVLLGLIPAPLLQAGAWLASSVGMR